MSVRWSVAVFVLGTVAACVGDNPEGGETNGTVVDAGASSGGSPPVESDGATTSALALSAAPVTVVRGADGVIAVSLQWTGTPTGASLSLEVPLALTAGAAQTVDSAQTAVTLQLSAKADAAFSTVPVNVVARSLGSDGAVLARTVVQVEIRGALGTLDTSFGVAGVVDFTPADGRLADIALSDTGELFAIGEEGRLRRYDANGVFDAAYDVVCFSFLGEDHLAYRKTIELGPNGTWSVLVHDASGDYDVFSHCSMAAAPAQDFVQTDISASTFETDASLLGLVSLGASTLVVQELAAGQVKAKIYAVDSATLPVTSWASNGSYELSASLPSVQPFNVVDFQASAEHLFVLGNASGSWSVDVLGRTSGALVGRVAVGAGVRSISRPSPTTGAVTLVRSALRPCMSEIVPGLATAVPSVCPGDSDLRDAKAVYLRDGRRAVVALGAVSTLWTFDAQGLPEAPLEGVNLQLPAVNFRLLQIYEDADRRLVIGAASPELPAANEWLIRRYWL